MIDRDERSRAREYLQTTIIPSEAKFSKLVRDFQYAERNLARAKLDKGSPRGQRSVEVADAPPPGTAADVAGLKKGDTLTVEAFRALEDQAEGDPQGRPGFAAARRSPSSSLAGVPRAS